MHPFYEGGQSVYKVWFIHSTDPNKQYDFIRHSPIAQIPSQDKITGVNDIRTLYKKLKMSYEMFDDENIIDYGYILFAKQPAGDHSVLLLESNLLSIIRNLWYNQQYV